MIAHTVYFIVFGLIIFFHRGYSPWLGILGSQQDADSLFSVPTATISGKSIYLFHFGRMLSWFTWLRRFLVQPTCGLKAFSPYWNVMLSVTESPFSREVTDGVIGVWNCVLIHSSIQMSSCYVQARAQMMVGLVVTSMCKTPNCQNLTFCAGIQLLPWGSTHTTYFCYCMV